MSSNTVSTSADGTVTVTSTDEGDTATVVTPAPPPPPNTAIVGVPAVVLRRHHDLDGGSFAGGIVVGVATLLAFQRRARRQRHRPVDLARRDPGDDRMAADVAALARRTATLETIVTDPARRTAEQIDALR